LAGRLQIAIGWFKLCVVRASFDIGNPAEERRELSGAHRVKGVQLEGFPPAWAGR